MPSNGRDVDDESRTCSQLSRDYSWYDTSIDKKYMDSVVQAVKEGQLGVVRTMGEDDEE